MNEDEKEFSLMDIVSRPSEIRTKISPTYMLNDIMAPHITKDGKGEKATPLMKAIIDDDFEAFVQILEMHSSLPGGGQFTMDVVALLMTHDRPVMLDELIRRTGQGIALTVTEDASTDDDGDHDEIAQELEANKMYLGLNVHGKKRKDLARKGDPNAPGNVDESDTVPMLWQAARHGALGVLRYLASDQPVAAYKFYMSSHGDARAKLLKKIPDLAAALPAKLGWTPNRYNETVVTAALSAQKGAVLEALLSIASKDIEPMLHTKYVIAWLAWVPLS